MGWGGAIFILRFCRRALWRHSTDTATVTARGITAGNIMMKGRIFTGIAIRGRIC